MFVRPAPYKSGRKVITILAALAVVAITPISYCMKVSPLDIAAHYRIHDVAVRMVKLPNTGDVLIVSKSAIIRLSEDLTKMNMCETDQKWKLLEVSTALTKHQSLSIRAGNGSTHLAWHGLWFCFVHPQRKRGWNLKPYVENIADCLHFVLLDWQKR